MEAVKQLVENYQDINQKVRNLNRGGCGVFAENLYHTLIKMGYEPELGVITKNKIGMDRILTNKSEFNKKGMYFGGQRATVDHVVVILNGKLIDSRGIWNNANECWKTIYCKNYKLSSLLSIEMLYEWNRDEYFWNYKFDRRNIKTIENKLKNCYKKINKNLEVSI